MRVDIERSVKYLSTSQAAPNLVIFVAGLHADSAERKVLEAAGESLCEGGMAGPQSVLKYVEVAGNDEAGEALFDPFFQSVDDMERYQRTGKVTDRDAPPACCVLL